MRKFSVMQLVSAGVATLLTASFFYVLQYYSNAGPLNKNRIITIEKGLGLTAISDQLYSGGIIDHPWLFELHLRMRGQSHHVRAGEFEMPTGASPQQVFKILSTGPFVQHAITVPEGMKTSEILDLLKQDPKVDTSNLTAVKEGELLPETYYYTRQEQVDLILSRMKSAMKEALRDAWLSKGADYLLKSEFELLTLASIVEKETAKDEERAHVATVFLNRLRLGMPLQSDPTVIYGLAVEHQRSGVELSKSDLKVPSQYNTYLNKGLPPGPICNPGKASIKAVAQPIQSEDLYFVADGTGGHVFAKTYEEHMKNHQKWRKIRDGKGD